MDNTLKSWKKVVNEDWYSNRDAVGGEEEFVDMQQELPSEDVYRDVDDVGDDGFGYTMTTDELNAIVDALRKQGNNDLADQLEAQDAALKQGDSKLDRDVDPESIPRELGGVDYENEEPFHPSDIDSQDDMDTVDRQDFEWERREDDESDFSMPMSRDNLKSKYRREGFEGKWDELVDRINEKKE
jgi:hypothetical protein